MRELDPGLSYWLAPHPEWGPEENWPEGVMCVRYESADGLVLIDPQLWPDSDDAFLELGGRPPAVLLTSPWHARDAAVFVERYGSSVWPRTTEELPSGIEVIRPAADDNQALFLFPEHRTLFTGDVFSGTGGRFHVFIDEEDIAEEDRGRFLDSLAQLADLPIEKVLIAHGESIFEDGAERIREAVAEARSQP